MLGLALLASCNAEKPVEKKPAAVKELTSKVRFKTNKGDVVIQLNGEKAPVTVANFLKYVKLKQFDGTVFHRVIGSFMIQGGGFALEGGKLVEKKTGDAIKNEGRNGLKNDTGTIAMARTSDPDSATAQFFINVGDNEALNFPNNGGYAVFGKVVEGMDVVKKIEAVETKAQELSMLHPTTGEIIPSMADDVPIEPIVIESATAE